VKPLRVSIVMACLMVGALVAGVVIRPPAKAPGTAPRFLLENIVPTKFGDWRELPAQGVQVVNPQTKELLDKLYSQTLTRTYANANGYRIMLSMAYGDDQRGNLQAHKPEVCYPAQGFQLHSNAEDELAKYQGDPEQLCMVGLWAYNPPAMLNAVKGKKLAGKVKIVGFDEDIETLQGIDDGVIAGTIVQQPFEFGYQAVKLMTALARGEPSGIPADGIVFVPHETIRRDNVVAFRAKLEKLRQPSAN